MLIKILSHSPPILPFRTLIYPVFQDIIIFEVNEINLFLTFVDCHRFDQSSLAILTSNYYNHSVKLYVDYMAKNDAGEFLEVKRHSYKGKVLKNC